MKKIVVTSDFHGHLPDIPECDLLLIAGDIAPGFRGDKGPLQMQWLETTFAPWLYAQPVGRTVAIPGNHDWWAERMRPKSVPWTLLIDETVTWEGLRIHGCPWSLTFFEWAFMVEADILADIHRAIPVCDILLSHGPAFGYGDRTVGNELTGALSLLTTIERITPKLVLTGHIHEAGGEWMYGDTRIINNSYLDHRYRFARDPRIVELTI